MDFLISQFTNFLLAISSITHSLGLSIIIFTILIRSFLLPITLKSLTAQKKINDLKPEADKLKKKYGNNKKAFQEAQMGLYKKYNINPLAGCLPQLVQLGVLIILYQALIKFLGADNILGLSINSNFLWMDLIHPDSTLILPIAAGISQLILSIMIVPGGETADLISNTSKKKQIMEANKKEEDVADMAASMQKQMIFIMPIMTGFFAAKFPSGLALYWVATTIFSIVQQYFISGWGGLKTYYLRLKNKL